MANALALNNGAQQSGATWETSLADGSFPDGGRTIGSASGGMMNSHTAQGGNPLYAVGGYSLTAASVHSVGNAQQLATPQTGGVVLDTSTSSEMMVDGGASAQSSGYYGGGNVFSSAWSNADANSRVIMILMVVGILLQLKGGL